MLSIAAYTFSQLFGINTEIIFDRTSLPTARNFNNKRPSVDLQPSPINPKLPVSEIDEEVFKFAKNFPAVGAPVTFSNGTFFMVSCARPQFATTDDKLISWARLNSSSSLLGTATTSTTTTTTTAPVELPIVSSVVFSEPNQSVLVVSSDRALAGELSSLGVALMKPTAWIELFTSFLENSAPMEIDNNCQSKKATRKIFDEWLVKFVIE